MCNLSRNFFKQILGCPAMPWLHARTADYALALTDGYLNALAAPLVQRVGAYKEGAALEAAVAEAICYREVGPWVTGGMRAYWPKWAEVWVVGADGWSKAAPEPFATLAAGETDPRYRVILRGRPYRSEQYVAADTARAVRDAGLVQRKLGPQLAEFKRAGALLLDTVLEFRADVPGGISGLLTELRVPWRYAQGDVSSFDRSP